jgi:hypothetical protein
LASVVVLGLLHLTTLVQVVSKLAEVTMFDRPEPDLATLVVVVTLPRAS